MRGQWGDRNVGREPMKCDAETKIAFLPVAMTQTRTVAILLCLSDPERSGKMENEQDNGTKVPFESQQGVARRIADLPKCPLFVLPLPRIGGSFSKAMVKEGRLMRSRTVLAKRLMRDDFWGRSKLRILRSRTFPARESKTPIIETDLVLRKKTDISEKSLDKDFGNYYNWHSNKEWSC